MENDFAFLPNATLLICTDYAVTMNLRAKETTNSSVNAHAINDNFVCINNRRVSEAKVKQKENGEESVTTEQVTLFAVNVHHFFAETISKDKKTDHAMHNCDLDAIIKKYRTKFEEEMGCQLRTVILWTDNAPTQYRCRQNFTKVASAEERHPGIKIIHRLAVVDQFKGYHDAVGKDPAHLVQTL